MLDRFVSTIPVAAFPCFLRQVSAVSLGHDGRFLAKTLPAPGTEISLIFRSIAGDGSRPPLLSAHF